MTVTEQIITAAAELIGGETSGRASPERLSLKLSGHEILEDFFDNGQLFRETVTVMTAASEDARAAYRTLCGSLEKLENSLPLISCVGGKVCSVRCEAPADGGYTADGERILKADVIIIGMIGGGEKNG